MHGARLPRAYRQGTFRIHNARAGAARNDVVGWGSCFGELSAEASPRKTHTPPQAELRIGRMAENDKTPYPPLVPAWHHVDCYFRTFGNEPLKVRAQVPVHAVQQCAQIRVMTRCCRHLACCARPVLLLSVYSLHIYCFLQLGEICSFSNLSEEHQALLLPHIDQAPSIAATSSPAAGVWCLLRLEALACRICFIDGALCASCELHAELLVSGQAIRSQPNPFSSVRHLCLCNTAATPAARTIEDELREQAKIMWDIHDKFIKHLTLKDCKYGPCSSRTHRRSKHLLGSPGSVCLQNHRFRVLSRLPADKKYRRLF